MSYLIIGTQFRGIFKAELGTDTQVVGDGESHDEAVGQERGGGDDQQVIVVDEHIGGGEFDHAMVQKLWIVFDVVDPSVGRCGIGPEKKFPFR